MEKVETVMQEHMTEALTPGYSTPRDTFRFLSYVAANELPKGTKVTVHLLTECGITGNDRYEVLGTSRHLGWIDKQDCLTEECIQLAQAKGDETEYRRLLSQNIMRSYASVYKSDIDPAHATPKELQDLFVSVGYGSPKLVRQKVNLFRGLYREAGMLSDNETSQESGEQTQSQIAPMDASITSGKDVPKMEHMPVPGLNGLASKDADATIISLLDMLTVLRQVHNNPDWTEATRKSWRKAIAGHVNLLHTLLEEEK